MRSMSSMFEGCTSFNVDLSDWDVDDCTDFNNMFGGTPEVFEIDFCLKRKFYEIENLSQAFESIFLISLDFEQFPKVKAFGVLNFGF